MKVSAVIVTYNGMQWIGDCLRSLEASNDPVSIVVVDNKSSDGTSGFIRENFPKVHLIDTGENLGFGKGNNVGIRYARSQDADFVFLLNQDAFVYPETIGPLVEAAVDNPDYGIISPIHLNADATLLEWSFSHFMNIDLARDFYSDFVMGRAISKIYSTSFVNAAAWLLPRKVLDEVGGFDPIFWHYGEDNNYCQRVLFHGFKIGVVPGVYIRHDSRRRKRPSDYQFSDRHFSDYIKEMQMRAADPNKPEDVSLHSRNRKKFVKELIRGIIRLEKRRIRFFWKLLRKNDSVTSGIFESRRINKTKGSHYL